MPMPFLKQVQENWKALAVIGIIAASAIGGWNYAMAQVKETTKTEVQAQINKEMVDGAKKAAADAVKEQLPIIAKAVADEVVKAQKAEAEKVSK